MRGKIKKNVNKHKIPAVETVLSVMKHKKNGNF